MKRKTVFKWSYALLAVGLLMGFSAVFWLARSADFSRSDAIINNLRAFKQIDTEWDLHIARATSNLVAADSHLEKSLTDVRQLISELQSDVHHYWGNDPKTQSSLASGLAQLQALMEIRFELMEDMESENSLARKSVVLLRPILNQITGAAVEAGVAEVVEKSLESTGQKLYADTLMYTYSASAEARSDILHTARELASTAAELPTDIRDAVALYISHILTVLEQRDGRAEVLRQQIESIDVGALVDRITSIHEQANIQLLDRMQDYQRILTIYSAILLMLLAFIGWRFLRNFQALNHSNARLQQAHNELQESHLQLVQSEKMASLGQMVAGVAHEINTPLAYVKGTFDILHSSLEPVHSLTDRCMEFSRLARVTERNRTALTQKFLEIEERARHIVGKNLLHEMNLLIANGTHGIEKISEIVINLKNFSRLDREKNEEFFVEAGLDSTLLLARNIIKDKVEIHQHYSQTPAIVGAPSQINQVFLNIITNALHAIEARGIHGGVIALRTSVDAAKKMVVTEIKDNGSGIPTDNLTKIFDPFYTTKPIGQGTGLGLSISYKIIKEHGGEITVQSRVGEGTSFFIWLPFKQEKEKDADPGKASGTPLFLD